MASKPEYAPGQYVCEIVGQGFSVASTGTPQFFVQFTVKGKPDPDNPDNYIVINPERQRVIFRAITEKAIPYVVEDLRALGFSGNSFKMLDPGTPGFHDFRGKVVDLLCDVEPDRDGNPREKWGFLRSSSMKLDPLPPNKLRELDNLFGKHLKSSAKPVAGSAVKSAQTAVAEVDGISDDDVPF